LVAKTFVALLLLPYAMHSSLLGVSKFEFFHRPPAARQHERLPVEAPRGWSSTSLNDERARRSETRCNSNKAILIQCCVLHFAYR
jgi:hypothetical protein